MLMIRVSLCLQSDLEPEMVLLLLLPPLLLRPQTFTSFDPTDK